MTGDVGGVGDGRSDGFLARWDRRNQRIVERQREGTPPESHRVSTPIGDVVVVAKPIWLPLNQWSSGDWPDLIVLAGLALLMSLRRILRRGQYTVVVHRDVSFIRGRHVLERHGRLTKPEALAMAAAIVVRSDEDWRLRVPRP